MLAGKRGQLLHALGIFIQYAGHVHELGQANHLGVVAMRDQVGGSEPGAGSFEVGCGHTGGELHPQIERGVLGGIEEILQSHQAQNIRDFVRVTNRGGDAMGKHTAVELQRSHQRALAVHVAIDKAGHGEAALGIDLLHPAVAVEGAHDEAAAHGDVAGLQFAGDQVQDAGVAHHQVRGQPAHCLIDLPFQNISHAQPPCARFRIIG